MKKTLCTTTVMGGLLVCATAQAASFGMYDPRSMAMGGVGVTTATISNASFFNPAALAEPRKELAFAIALPAVSARAYDPDKLVDDIDSVQNAGDKLTDSLTAFNNAVNTVNAATPTTGQVNDLALKSSTLAADIRNFDTQLNKINQKKVELGAFAGTIIAAPGNSFGLGLYGAARADLGAHFNYDGNDSTTLQGHASTADSINAAATSCSATPSSCGTFVNTIDSTGDTNIDNLASTFLVRGAAMEEAGISLASRFEVLGNVDIGVTPKYVKVQTFDYALNAQSTDVDMKMGRKDHSNFNFDIGVSKAFGEDYKAGLVIKNVLPQEYKTILGNTIETSAQARAGVSHHTSWSTLGLDMDLTRNKGAAGGFDKESQFIGLGGEADWGVLKLRAGYRHDMTGNYGGLPSLGLGLAVFGFHLDAAVAKSSDEMTASVQLAYVF